MVSKIVAKIDAIYEHSSHKNGDSPTPKLAPHHYEQLTKGSGIDPVVIAERGYRTCRDLQELKSHGIRINPGTDATGLLIPVYGIDGKPLHTYDLRQERSTPLFIYRPDRPQPDKKGRAPKYLYPSDVEMSQDYHPRSHQDLDDPTKPLWITEGVKKEDALITHGACAIGLHGVWNWKKTNAKGGKTANPDWLHIALNNREVRIVYDSDIVQKASIQYALDGLVTLLGGRGAHVKVAYLPSENGAKVGVDDYLLTHSLQDLERLLEVPRGRQRPTADDKDKRPVVHIGPDITRMVDEGQAALLALPHGPVLFQRARRLSIIARSTTPPKWLHRPGDAPVIAEAQTSYLEELATKAARWEKYEKRGKEWVEVTPPARFIKTLQARPAWPFPLLEGIIHSPTLRPDGSVLNAPGYDTDTGLYFDSNGTTFPALPRQLTIDHARSAIGALQEVVPDFPFLADWHFSAWISAVLSVVCRYTILGCVPLHGITATTRGSGKSLLADTIAIIGTGHTAARWSQVFDEDEERKRLLSLALDGDPLVCIDNITMPLGSGALALALTASSIKDRLLGANQTKEAPMSAVFLCTGNNVQYIGDVARRVVPIALDPKMERPEERTGFQHNPLLAWVQCERPRLTIAALSIVKAYFDAGCPSQGLTPLGSFEAWSDVIRQAIVWAGEEDPCEGRKDIEAASNPEHEALAVLLHAWHACYGTQSVTLKKVLDDVASQMQHVGPDTTANKWNDLHDALGSCDSHYDGRRLDAKRIGYAIRKWQGQVIDGTRLTSPGSDRAKVALWRVELF